MNCLEKWSHAWMLLPCQIAIKHSQDVTTLQTVTAFKASPGLLRAHPWPEQGVWEPREAHLEPSFSILGRGLSVQEAHTRSQGRGSPFCPYTTRSIWAVTGDSWMVPDLEGQGGRLYTGSGPLALDLQEVKDSVRAEFLLDFLKNRFSRNNWMYIFKGCSLNVSNSHELINKISRVKRPRNYRSAFFHHKLHFLEACTDGIIQ